MTRSGSRRSGRPRTCLCFSRNFFATRAIRMLARSFMTHRAYSYLSIDPSTAHLSSSVFSCVLARAPPAPRAHCFSLSLSLSLSLPPTFTQIRQSADVAEALHLRPFDLTHMHHDSWLLNMLHVGRMLRRGGGNARGRGEGRRGGGSYASAGEDHRGGGGGGEVPTAAGAAVACERSGRTTARRAGAVD